MNEYEENEFHKFWDAFCGEGNKGSSASYDSARASWIAAKRSQPSVVLPKEVNPADYFCGVYDAEEIHERLTAAGIKYTTGE